MCITQRLKDKYGFYAGYHTNFWNKLVHSICIPAICFSLFVLLNYIPLEFDISNFIPTNTTSYAEDITIPKCTMILRPSFILYMLYFVYYLYLIPCIGLMANVFYFGVLLASNYFYCQVQYAYAFAIGIQVLSWIFQILGHKCFEGNSPAFTTGLYDSILVAPLFVVLEIVKYVFVSCFPKLKNLKPMSSVNFGDLPSTDYNNIPPFTSTHWTQESY